MPTVLSHAVFASALGSGFQRGLRPLRLWTLGAFCAMAADLDVVGMRMGIPYEAPFGHRGATHSLAFAAALAALATALALARRRGAARELSPTRLLLFFFLAAASHGALDSMTNGGLGVAFLWPIDGARFFAPWRPIQVSPLGVGAFLGARGVGVLASEAAWVWIPSAALALGLRLLRRRPG